MKSESAGVVQVRLGRDNKVFLGSTYQGSNKVLESLKRAIHLLNYLKKSVQYCNDSLMGKNVERPRRYDVSPRTGNRCPPLRLQPIEFWHQLKRIGFFTDGLARGKINRGFTIRCEGFWHSFRTPAALKRQPRKLCCNTACSIDEETGRRGDKKMGTWNVHSSNSCMIFFSCSRSSV